MSLDQGTAVVNGQRFTTPTWGAYAPVGFGPQTTAVPIITPAIPPMVGGGGGSVGGLTENIGGYGTAGNNSYATAVAAANPWSPRQSPVIWAIVGLLLSIFLLRHVHWRDTLEAGGGAHVGPIHVGGEAGSD